MNGKLQNEIWEKFGGRLQKANPLCLAVNTVLAGKYLAGPVSGTGRRLLFGFPVRCAARRIFPGTICGLRAIRNRLRIIRHRLQNPGENRREPAGNAHRPG